MTRRKDCGMLIKLLHDELEKNANNVLRDKNLTISQVSALMELNQAEEQKLSLKEMEKILHVAQSTVVGIMKRLEEKGFVEEFGSNEDKRIKIVHITKAGIQCCSDADENMRNTEKRLLSGLTEEEQKTFAGLLEKASRNIW